MGTKFTPYAGCSKDAKEKATSSLVGPQTQRPLDDCEAAPCMHPLSVVEIATVISLKYPLVSDLELDSEDDLGPNTHVMLP